MFAQATRLKLRFSSTRGLLSVEELWDLPLRGKLSLDTLAISAKKELEASEKDSVDSFVDQRGSIKDPELELRLEILKHIISVRLSEENEAKDRKAKRDHNQKILALIDMKKERELEGLSVEELEKLLKQ